MDRRTFLKLSALTGLSVATPLSTSVGGAQAEAYGGPYWALVNASGGWDPRFMFDPIGPGGQNRLYTNVGAVGNIQYADFPIDLAQFNISTEYAYETMLMTPGQFLQIYGNRLTVLNGVDTQTNNHDAGSRTMWSGQITGQYPSIGALIAAARAPRQPIPFISGGGYDRTDGLVPLARVENPDTLKKIAYPNQMDPDNPETELYHTADTWSRIVQTQADRVEALAQSQYLPRISRSIEDLKNARVGVADLERLSLPADLVDLPGGDLGDLERMQRQAQLAVAGFSSGMTVTASLSIGGFDTHGDHDRDQPRQITKLLAGIDFLMNAATMAGIVDNMYVVVTSDFGRTPMYNSDNDNGGKDHWPIGSMLVMGPGIPGNRVIGATNGEQRALNLDPGNLTPVNEGGVKLTPEAIHTSLRQVAGVQDIAGDYPLAGGDALALFG